MGVWLSPLRTTVPKKAGTERASEPGGGWKCLIFHAAETSLDGIFFSPSPSLSSLLGPSLALP